MKEKNEQRRRIHLKKLNSNESRITSEYPVSEMMIKKYSYRI